MKVVCIKYNLIYLTKGKTYNSSESIISYSLYVYENAYKIIDDINEEGIYPKKWFKPLSEIRNDKINKLLEE